LSSALSAGAAANRGFAGEPILRINGLHTEFKVHGGVVKAVDGVTLTIPAGKTVGLVGESGCGKSITALSVMQLLESNGRITSGEILFHGQDMLAMTPERIREIRGNDIGMIFQEPMTALNPVFSVGDQIAEAVKLHQEVSNEAARARAIEMLKLVGISDAERRAGEYPHELSGGMRQRVMIAMALSCNPDLLIADEPTTALDVTIQAQILELMRELQARMGSAILLITHDLGVVAEMCDEVAVMYAGRIVEQASTADIFAHPKHPYTQGLLASIPKLGFKQDRLHVITGGGPNPLAMPLGCRFHPRCPNRFGPCDKQIPMLSGVAPDHLAACFLYPEVKGIPVGSEAPVDGRVVAAGSVDRV
jgi:oligopeptide/dipeptide ABC transporter ATP-binding protein